MAMTIAQFCRDPRNSVSRERIFFHKLYFDLKLAAARSGYPLTLFEPEVDRDAYDVVLDDGDAQRRVQLKTVLKSATTAKWNSTNRFLLLEETYGDDLGLSPGDCGVGGAFILIEIDDSDDEGRVRYLYTDYYVLQALASQMVKEAKSRRAYKSFGKPAMDRTQFATQVLQAMHLGGPRDIVTLRPKHFLRPRGPAELLTLLGLHSIGGIHLPCDKVMKAVSKGFVVDVDGTSLKHVSKEARLIAELAGQEILALIDEPLLTGYER